MKHNRLFSALSLAAFMTVSLVAPASVSAASSDPAVLMDETFDNYEEGTDATTFGFVKNSASDPCTATVAYHPTDTAKKNPVLRFNGRCDRGIYYKFSDTALPKGTYRVSYKIYMNTGSNEFFAELPNDPTQLTKGFFFAISRGPSGGFSCSCPDAWLASQNGSWHEFEYTINTDTGVVREKVTVNGQVLRDSSCEASKAVNGNKDRNDLSSITSIRFRNWGNGGETYIDDIKVEKEVARVKLDDYSVSYELKDGTVTSGKKEINPNVKKIILDFDAVLGGNTADYVTLEKNGNPVGFTGTEDESKYIMELDNVLTENSSYKLTVGSEVESKDNIPLGEEFVYEFTTGERSTIVAPMDFTDCNSKVDLQKLGWTMGAKDNVSMGKPAGSTDENDNAIVLNYVDEGVKYHIFDEDVTSGVYKISYRLQATGNKVSVDLPMNMSSFARGSLFLLHIDKGNPQLNFTGSIKVANGSIELGKWYRYEHLVDMYNRTVSTTIYTDDGVALGAPASIAFTNGDSQYPDDYLDHIKGIRLRNWSTTPMYFDDFKVSRHYAPISVGEGSVYYEFTDGTSGRGSDDVNPSIKSIVVEFGGEIDEYTTGGITLTKGSEPVAFTGRISGDKYYLDLKNVLDASSEYTLTIDETVANPNGDTLPSGLVHTFTTKEAVATAKISSVKSNGNVVSAIDDIASGASVTAYVDYENTTNNDMTLTCVIACYNAKSRMVGIKIADPITAAAKTSKTVGVTLTSVPSGTERIQVMLTDGLGTMIPYSSFVTIAE